MVDSIELLPLPFTKGTEDVMDGCKAHSLLGRPFSSMAVPFDIPFTVSWQHYIALKSYCHYRSCPICNNGLAVVQWAER